jgi:hypothetical protein
VRVRMSACGDRVYQTSQAKMINVGEPGAAETGPLRQMRQPFEPTLDEASQ